MDIFCKVTPNGLIPLYDSDYENKHRLKNGSVVKCKITKPRNLAFHKKFFAMVRLTYENLPFNLVEKWGIHNEADMLRQFKRDLGYFTAFKNERGETEIEYLSISFSAMEQHDFEDFFSQCVDLVLNKYIRGIDRFELIEEIERFK